MYSKGLLVSPKRVKHLKTRRNAGSVELAEHFKQSEPSAFGLANYFK